MAKGGAWHEPELIRRGYTVEGLAGERKQFGLIAWQDRYGGWHYPKWQFDADGRILPEVRSILRLFRSRDAIMRHDVITSLTEVVMREKDSRCLLPSVGSLRYCELQS